MAVGDESIGYGATVEVNDGTAGAFEPIPKVVSLGIPDYTVGTVESKRLDLDDRTVIDLPTLKTGQALTITTQLTNAGHERFKTIRDSFTEMQWRFTIPDDDSDTVITVPGILTNVKVKDVTPDGITEFDLMVKVSGAEI